MVLALRADRARYMHLTFIRYLHTHVHTQTAMYTHTYIRTFMLIHVSSHTRKRITSDRLHPCSHTQHTDSQANPKALTHRCTHTFKHLNIIALTLTHSSIQSFKHSNIQTLKHTNREGDGYAEAFFSRYLMEDRYDYIFNCI